MVKRKGAVAKVPKKSRAKVTAKAVTPALFFGIVELMKNKIPTGTCYRTKVREMQVQFDIISAEKEIPANDSVRLIEQIVEEIDIAAF